MSTKIYRNVTTQRIFDWLPLVHYSMKISGQRKSIRVPKNEESTIKKLYPKSRKLKNGAGTIAHLNEIHKEVYETKRKWQLRRAPVACNKIEVPIQYSFSKAMGIYVKPISET